VSLVFLGSAFGVIVTFARLPRRAWDVIYAEDGAVFLEDWLIRPSVALLWEPYDGYLHLIPRIISSGVSLLPAAWWALASTAGAGAVTGAVGALSSVAARHLIQSRFITFAVGLVPLILPFAGVEALGNLANVHWYMLYLAFWIMFVSSTGTCRPILWGVVMFAATTTEIQVVILLPILALLEWRHRGHHLHTLAGVGIGAVAQVVSVLATGHARGDGLGDIGSAAKGYLANVVLGSISGNQARISWIIEITGWWMPALALVLCLGISVVLLRTEPALRIAGASALLASAATWFLSFLINNYASLSYDVPPISLIRWGTGATLLLWAWLLITVEGLAQRGVAHRRVAGMLVALAIGVAAAGSPALVPRRDIGSTWGEQVAAARVLCRDGKVIELHQAPGDWAMRVPCHRVRS